MSSSTSRPRTAYATCRSFSREVGAWEHQLAGAGAQHALLPARPDDVGRAGVHAVRFAPGGLSLHKRAPACGHGGACGLFFGSSARAPCSPPCWVGPLRRPSRAKRGLLRGLLPDDVARRLLRHPDAASVRTGARARAASWHALWLGVSLSLALVSKEEAFAIPLFVLAWAALLRPEGWWRALWQSALAMVFPCLPCCYFATPSWRRRRSPISPTSRPRCRADHGARRRLLPELLVAPLRSAPSTTGSSSATRPGFRAGWSRAPRFCALPPWVRPSIARRRRRFSRWDCLAFLGSAPVSQTIPIIVVAADRFLYLPMMGWALLVGLLLELAWRRARSRPIALGQPRPSRCYS